MKSIMITLILIGSAAMGMTHMPEGAYQGQGRWKDNKGQTGSYNIFTKVKSNVVSSSYHFNDKIKEYIFEAKMLENKEHFDVMVGGYKVGEGYCMSAQCHYSISFGKTVIEETLTFYQEHFYRLGSKQENGHVTTWEESMVKK